MMDEQSRNRLVGAVIWLGLLIFSVPFWYSNPIHFQPPTSVASKVKNTPQLVNKPFYLPVSKPVAHVRPVVSQPKPSQKKPPKIHKVDKPVTKTSPIKVKSKHPVKSVQTGKKQKQWILRVVAYRDKKMAETMKARLQYDYATYIKYFPKSKYYSVRIGPYKNRANLVKDQQKINRLLHVKSEIFSIQ